ncbi:MAG: hypothetical protein J0L56_01745 [Chitinophagales bacterium]|nr:hypothetical protein [Chitinophagales bacterium]
MRIAIFGWGSLIHSPGSLAHTGEWYIDGPFLPIGFTRISGIRENARRLTLVITEGFPEVQCLYTESTLPTLEEACDNLQHRENTMSHLIGYYNYTYNSGRILRSVDSIKQTLIKWNINKNYEAVIWTDIGPNFSQVYKSPYSVENIKSFLKTLSPKEFNETKNYILKTHPQIQVKFRKQIEALLETQF